MAFASHRARGFSCLRTSGSPLDDYDSGGVIIDQVGPDCRVLYAPALRAVAVVSGDRSSGCLLHLHDVDHVFPGQYTPHAPSPLLIMYRAVQKSLALGIS